MNRRGFLNTAAAGALTLPSYAMQGKQRPNLLYILVDSLAGWPRRLLRGGLSLRERPLAEFCAAALSLAWTPKSLHGRTVIRAGAGVFYGDAQLGDQYSPANNDASRYTMTQTSTPGLAYPFDPFINPNAALAAAPAPCQLTTTMRHLSSGDECSAGVGKEHFHPGWLQRTGELPRLLTHLCQRHQPRNREGTLPESQSGNGRTRRRWRRQLSRPGQHTTNQQLARSADSCQLHVLARAE